MKRIQCCGLLMAAIFSTAAAKPHRTGHIASSGDSVLWHGIRTGMTEQQVRQILPDLEKNDRNNGFHSAPQQVAGEPFDVGIDMSSGQVARVSLTSDHALPNEVKSALTAKYGEPAKPWECTSGMIYHCEAEWRAPGGVTVSLIQLLVQGSSSTEIRYEAPNTSGL
ncbi:hypothetical protein [Sphingomonas oryzagri]